MNQTLVTRWRFVTLASAALIACIVWAWQLTPVFDIEQILLAFVFCVPLLAPLPGLWRGNRYTYRWATFCVLPYFIVGLTEAIANPRTRLWAGAMLVAALVWFIALVAYLRVSADPNTVAPSSDVSSARR